MVAEVFAGSMTENFNPLMYGSVREVFMGLLRSLPDEDVTRLERAAQTARRLPRMVRETRRSITASCEVAGMLAEQTGAPAAVPGLLSYLTDRWDGHGPLARGKHEEIPLPMRIVHVATDAALQRRLGGVEHAVGLVRDRSGHAFDPRVAACLVEDGPAVLALDNGASAWDATLAIEPSPPLFLEGDALDRGLAAMGRFADLISPYFAGHSMGVAELASEAARRCRVDAAGVTAVRRAGLVHDLGRVAVHTRVWQKNGSLNTDDFEQVRLHPYHTERCLSRSPFLAGLAPVAAAHHERLDRTGYHRGSPGADLTIPARLRAAADAFTAMCEPRPHRAALGPERAAEALTAEANAGRLDPDAVTAVIEAAGQPAPRVERPAGLTEREAEVAAARALSDAEAESHQRRATPQDIPARADPAPATSARPTEDPGVRLHRLSSSAAPGGPPDIAGAKCGKRDIRNFFGEIDQERLLCLVGERVSDRRVLKLLRQWLRAGVLADGVVSETVAETPQGDPPGGVPVEPVAVGGEEDRLFDAFADRQVDGAGGARRERDDHRLASLADDGERPVTASDAERFDVGAERFASAESVDCQQRDQCVIARRGEPGGDEEGADLVAVEPGGVGLAAHERPATAKR